MIREQLPILVRMVREVLTYLVTFEQGFERNEEAGAGTMEIFGERTFEAEGTKALREKGDGNSKGTTIRPI